MFPETQSDRELLGTVTRMSSLAHDILADLTRHAARQARPSMSATLISANAVRGLADTVASLAAGMIHIDLSGQAEGK